MNDTPEIMFEIDTFESSVDEAYEELKLCNLNNKTKIKLPKFEFDNSTSSRFHWSNIVDICNTMNRDSDHFKSWLKNELVDKDISWLSGSKSDGIIIHGKGLQKPTIVNLVIKYSNIYVICSSCKTIETTMCKIARKQYKFKCSNCGMEKNIN